MPTPSNQPPKPTSAINIEADPALPLSEHGKSSKPTGPIGPYPEDLTGQNLDGLIITRRIGRGGMGDVWLGFDEYLDILVAIKVLPEQYANDPHFVMRFLREARAVAKLDHPNIVRVLQAGRREVNGHFIRVMVMEYLEGRDAQGLMRLQYDGKLEANRAAFIVLQAARALAYAHDRGVVHRDVKPANILVSEDEKTIKLVDFGLANLAPHIQAKDESGNKGLTEVGMVVGTAAYMAPEQARGKGVDPRSDIYSLGITLYEMLAGEVPFDGDSTLEILNAHAKEPLVFPVHTFGEIPPLLIEAIKGMCQKNTDQRWNLAQVRNALEGVLGMATGAALSSHVSSTWGRTNIVARTTSFVGREREIFEITKCFEDEASLVTVVGPGGVGKTRLAQELGLRISNGKSRDTWFCDLTEARNLDSLCQAVALGLGVPLTQANAVEQLATVIGLRGDCLLILDNFEQVTEFAQASLAHWRREAPLAQFLVTSREPLHLDGEQNIVLAPLEIGSAGIPAGNQPEAAIITPPAIQLFVDRAREVRRGFELSDDNRENIQAIVRHLDGIPLAIELAAARVAAFSPVQILERLPQRFELLKTKRRDASQRQATLRGAIDWSWNLLKPWEKSALGQCSIFQGGFFLEAAEAVIDLSAFPKAPFAMDVVESLREKSLLVSEDAQDIPGETRYRMLESIRQYAEEKLTELRRESSPVPTLSLTGLVLRHAKYYIEYAQIWNDKALSGRANEVASRLHLEIENYFAIQDAFEKLAASIDRFPAERAHLLPKGISTAREISAMGIASLIHVLTLRGPWRERVPRLERALALLRPNDPLRMRVRLCNGLAQAHTDCGTAEGLEAAVRESIALTKQIQGDDDEALTLKLLTCLACHVGLVRQGVANESIEQLMVVLKEAGVYDYTHARRDYSKSQALGSALAKCLSLRFIGHIERAEFQQARECFELAEAINWSFDSRTDVAFWYGMRGILHSDMGEFDEALKYYQLAEKMSREVNYRSRIAINLINQGVVYERLGDYGKASEFYERAEEIHRELGDKPGMIIVVGNRSTVQMQLGNFDEAWELASWAEAESRTYNLVRPLTYWLFNKARMLYLQEKDLDTAFAIASECIEKRESWGMDKIEEFFCTLALISAIELKRSNPGMAQEFALQAKALGDELPVPRVVQQGADAGQPNEFWTYVDQALGG